jgi:hypothetical protein
MLPKMSYRIRVDMWTDVFASPGRRTTGTRAQTLVIIPSGWRPDLRNRLIEELNLPKDTQTIEAPTPYVWIIGRIKTDGPADYDAVHKIQAGLKVTPLTQWGKTPEPVAFKPDPSVDMKTPPPFEEQGLRRDRPLFVCGCDDEVPARLLHIHCRFI